MSEEMKLLYAMCEALGFDVSVNLDYKERKESQNSAMRYNDGRLDHDRTLKAEGATNKLIIDKDGKYTSVLKKPETSYVVSPFTSLTTMNNFSITMPGD